MDISLWRDVIDVPSQAEVDQVDKLKGEYTALKMMKPEPPDFWPRAKSFREEICSLEPNLKQQIRDLGDAVKAYHIAVQKRARWKENDNIDEGSLWKGVEDSLTILGVPDWINSERERQKQIRDAEAKSAADAKLARAVAFNAKAASSSADTACDAVGSDSRGEDNVDHSSVSVVEVTDKDGNLVAIDSLL